MDTSRLIGLSGSLRAGSYNTALLREAARLAPVDVEVEVVVPSDLPMYDADVEAAGMPAPVEALRRKVAAAQGLLVATPEYNFSVSGVVKNAVDWLSRGGSRSPLHHKPTGLLSSAGGSGGSHALKHLRQILSHNRARVLAEPEVKVRRGSEHFIDGRPLDPAIEAQIEKLIQRVLELAATDEEVPDVAGSVFVIGVEEPSTDRIAALIAERGVRTLTAVTRRDTARVLGSRTVAAVVIDPGVAFDDAEGIQRELARGHPRTPVLRPLVPAVAADEAVALLRRLAP